jgi:predicted DNA binding CopG/RHH family protein
MKKEYDFSEAKKNPYIHDLKKQVTIRLDVDTIDYFKHLSEDNGVPYQTLDLPPISRRQPYEHLLTYSNIKGA